MWQVILFSTIFTEVCAQSSIGPWCALEQVTFFIPNVDADAGYHAEYDVPNAVTFGLSWSRPTGKGVLHVSAFVDRIRIAYTAGQTLPASAAFYNKSRHELTRLGLRVSYLGHLARGGRITILLGPGVGATGMHVNTSEGIGSGLGQASWTHTGREPGSFYPAYGSIHLLLQLRFRAWPRWEIAAGICPEVTITPWIRDSGVHFTSNFTLRNSIGVYYTLKKVE